MLGFLIALRYGEYRFQKFVDRNVLIQQDRAEPVPLYNPLYKGRSVAELLKLAKERK
jgi:hypothetical protein